jgi:hypothetical protein
VKTKSLTIFCLIVLITCNLQAQDEKNGFSDIKLSYNISSISAGGNHFSTGETLLPFGAGLEFVYYLGKRTYVNLGFIFKTSGNQTQIGEVISEFGSYSGPVYREYKQIFFDIPIQIQYKLIKTKPLDIYLSSGFVSTIYNYKSYNNPDFDGKVGESKDNSFNSGLEIGLIECIKINEKIELFTSQFYGYYLFGNLKEIMTIDLKIGLKYRI